MKDDKNISEKERIRREKIAAKFQERRRKGYAKYLKKKHREIEKRKKKEAEQKEKEKEKKKILKEREKENNKKKKKRGRPKKTGPKINYYKRRKKLEAKLIKKQLGPKVLPPYKYKIISCRNGLQNKFIGRYRTIEDAYEEFNKLKENEKNIIFPTLIVGLGVLENSIDEYILIEKQEEDELHVNKLRNEYGKYVDQVININGWSIIDKFRYKKEETFRIFGYKRTDRKTFQWIYDNLITSDLDNTLEYKRIILFKNKIIIKDDNGNIEFIICKHYSDAIRFYNLLETWIKRDKIKQIILVGDYSNETDKKRKLIDELVVLTGWSRKKVGMSTNSFNKSNKKEDKDE